MQVCKSIVCQCVSRRKHSARLFCSISDPLQNLLFAAPGHTHTNTNTHTHRFCLPRSVACTNVVPSTRGCGSINLFYGPNSPWAESHYCGPNKTYCAHNSPCAELTVDHLKQFGREREMIGFNAQSTKTGYIGIKNKNKEQQHPHSPTLLLKT